MTSGAFADIDHQIATLGEAANDSIVQVEVFFAVSHFEETTGALKIKAATWAIDKRASFHKSKNRIDNAILIEIFADVIAAERGPASRLPSSPTTTKISAERIGATCIQTSKTFLKAYSRK